MKNNIVNLKTKLDWLEGHINDSFINEEYEDESLLTVEDKVHFFSREVKRVAFYANNMKRFNNNHQAIIADYLQGLHLTIPFSNYDICELGKEWGYTIVTDKEYERFSSNYWKAVAMLVLQLFKKYDIKL